MSKYLVILLGGGLGSVARFVAGSAIMNRYTGRFPLGTFTINVTGSFLIGVLMTLFAARSNLHPNWRLLLVVGFLGGYTTFSSFEWETLVATREASPWLGLVYVLSSVAVGYCAVWLGALLAGRR